MSTDGLGHSQAELNAKTRRRFAVIAMFGGAGFAASYLGLLVYLSWADLTWMLPIIKAHFAAVVGAPCAALLALLVVLMLRYTAGEIEMKGLGFEFKGAAGPIILWIFSYLAVVTGIKALW